MTTQCVFTEHGHQCIEDATHFCYASVEDGWTHWTLTDTPFQRESMDGFKLTREVKDVYGRPRKPCLRWESVSW